MTVRTPSLRRLRPWPLAVAMSFLVTASVFGPASRAAWAEDPVPPAQRAADAPPAGATLASLTPDEREILRRRFPDWERLDAATQARIVGSVLKLRTLPPDQRDRFLDRMRRLDRAGPMTVENVAKNLPAFARATPERRAELVRVNVISRAVASSYAASWPVETRDALFGTGTGALSPEERRLFAGCVGGAWRRRVIEGLVQSPPLDVEPAEGTTDVRAVERATELVTLRDQVRLGGGAQSDLGLRKRYAGRVFDDRMLRAKATLGRRIGPPDAANPEAFDAPLVALGDRLRAAFPVASESLGAELLVAAAKGREGLGALCDKSAPDRPPMRERALWDLCFHLEGRRRDLTGDVLARTDDLEAAIFASLRVPEDRVRALRDATSPSARMRAVRKLFEEFGPRPNLPRNPERNPERK